MRKIIDEKPAEIYGRNLFALNFTNKNDLKNKMILDIGCGFGWFEAEALKKGAKEIVGIDISQETIRFARDNIKDKRASFLKDSAIKLSFPDEKFDMIVAWEVIEHVPQGSEKIFFSEIFRVLKKGGYVYLSTPNDNFFAKLFDPAFFLLKHRHYRPNNLLSLASEANFKIEKIDIRGGWGELTGGINLLLAKWVFKRDLFLKKIFISWQNKEYKKEGFTALFLKLKKA